MLGACKKVKPEADYPQHAPTSGNLESLIKFSRCRDCIKPGAAPIARPQEHNRGQHLETPVSRLVRARKWHSTGVGVLNDNDHAHRYACESQNSTAGALSAGARRRSRARFMRACKYPSHGRRAGRGIAQEFA